MSILGYSASYFLPEYWAASPLYGEKIIPLIDYLLSTDYVETEKLATAFYNLENKYKNTANLPIEQIEAIIEESGYGYVRELLGNDEDSIRLLTYLLVLIHQLKGSKAGIEVVLNLLRSNQNSLVLAVVGNPTISPTSDLSDITVDNYVYFKGFTTNSDAFQLKFQIRTSAAFVQDQAIASVSNNLMYLGINSEGKLVLSLGNNGTSWNIVERAQSTAVLQPNTTYYVRINFDGIEYNVQVSEDDKRYANALTVSSSQPLMANKSLLYVGVDGSTLPVTKPYQGYINLGTFSTNIENLKIEQWFETDPMGEEDTFSIKADLDINILNSDFFKNFSSFVKKYVYPSLAAFEAKLNLENNITFLPYSRQKITYIASADIDENNLLAMDSNNGWEDLFVLDGKFPDTDLFGDLGIA